MSKMYDALQVIGTLKVRVPESDPIQSVLEAMISQIRAGNKFDLAITYGSFLELLRIADIDASDCIKPLQDWFSQYFDADAQKECEENHQMTTGHHRKLVQYSELRLPEKLELNMRDVFGSTGYELEKWTGDPRLGSFITKCEQQSDGWTPVNIERIGIVKAEKIEATLDRIGIAIPWRKS